MAIELPDKPWIFDDPPSWVMEGLGEMSDWERQQIGHAFHDADRSLREAILSLSTLLGRLHREEPTRPISWSSSAVSRAAEGYAAVDRLLARRDGVIHRHALAARVDDQ